MLSKFSLLNRVAIVTGAGLEGVVPLIPPIAFQQTMLCKIMHIEGSGEQL